MSPSPTRVRSERVSSSSIWTDSPLPESWRRPRWAPWLGWMGETVPGNRGGGLLLSPLPLSVPIPESKLWDWWLALSKWVPPTPPPLSPPFALLPRWPLRGKLPLLEWWELGVEQLGSGLWGAGGVWFVATGDRRRKSGSCRSFLFSRPRWSSARLLWALDMRSKNSAGTHAHTEHSAHTHTNTWKCVQVFSFTQIYNPCNIFKKYSKHFHFHSVNMQHCVLIN